MISSTSINAPVGTCHCANKVVSENVRITHFTVKLLGLKQRVNNCWTDGFKLERSAECREEVLEGQTGRK